MGLSKSSGKQYRTRSVDARARRASRLLGGVALALALGVSSVAHAAGVSVDKASDAQKKDAQAAFTTGLEKTQAGDHAAALASFRASFDVVASPNAELMIVRELAALGKYLEAYEEALATEKLAREASAIDKKYAETEKSAHDESVELAKKIGFVKVDLAGQSGEISVGGRVVEPGKAVAVMPGEVEVTRKDASGAVETKKVSVTAGQELAVDFAPAGPPVEPPKETPSKSMHPFDMGTGQRITAGVFLGVGAVGMGLFAGFGVANQSRYSDLEERCATTGCTQDEIDEGRTFHTAANVSVIVGGVGLAAGAALLIPTFFAKKSDAKAEEKAAVRVDAVHVGLGSLGLQGSFQ